MFRSAEVGSAGVRFGRKGRLRLDASWMVWQERRVEFCTGTVGFGRMGMFRYGELRMAEAWQAWCVESLQGAFRWGKAGSEESRKEKRNGL